MRLLLVEDDRALQANLHRQLLAAKYCVDLASDGQEGLFLGTECSYDGAIIDVGLPLLDGISLVRQLRKQNIAFPILILTARDRWQDKVEGLDAGADDYLTKPFQVQELLARLNALIRRSVGKASPIITNGPLTLNTTSLQVCVDRKMAFMLLILGYCFFSVNNYIYRDRSIQASLRLQNPYVPLVLIRSKSVCFQTWISTI